MNKGADIILKTNEGIGKRLFSLLTVCFPLRRIEYKTAGREKTSVSGTDNIPTDLIYT